MRTTIIKVLAQKGQSAVNSSIDKTIQDLKQSGYYRSEIKETIREFYFGLDGKVDQYIISKGY